MGEWINVILRTWLAMVILYMVTKLLGKRQVSQLSLFEYMTGLTLGSVVAYITLNAEGKWMLGILALAVWGLTSVAISWFQLKSKRFRDWLDGKGTIIIQNGRILEQNMRKERLTIDEMMVHLRNRNAFNLADVEFAIMEPTGEINVLLKKQHQPLTLQHLHPRQGEGNASDQIPAIVIMDGMVLAEELKRIGRDQAWLEAELEKQALRIKEVFVAEVNSAYQLNIYPFYQQKEDEGKQNSSAVLTDTNK